MLTRHGSIFVFILTKTLFEDFFLSAEFYMRWNTWQMSVFTFSVQMLFMGSVSDRYMKQNPKGK